VINWEAVGAVAELGGALAVVITLVYLAGQVRESRKATLASVYQERANARGDINLGVALNNPNFHDILFRFQSAFEESGPAAAASSLSAAELFPIRQYYRNLMIRMDNLCFQDRLGLIPDSYRSTVTDGVLAYAPLWEVLKIDLSGELEPRVIAETRSSPAV
jgi:hypothetical protein